MVKLNKKEAEDLLGIFCIKYGFCIYDPEYEQLANNPPEDPDVFVTAVYKAEGLTPDELDLSVFRAMRNEVLKAFAKHEERVFHESQVE